MTRKMGASQILCTIVIVALLQAENTPPEITSEPGEKGCKTNFFAVISDQLGIILT
jgi:hypothetical protein